MFYEDRHVSTRLLDFNTQNAFLIAADLDNSAVKWAMKFWTKNVYSLSQNEKAFL